MLLPAERNTLLDNGVQAFMSVGSISGAITERADELGLSLTAQQLAELLTEVHKIVHES